MLEAANLLDDVERVVVDDVLHDPLHVVRVERARTDASLAVDGAVARSLSRGAASEPSESRARVRRDAAVGLDDERHDLGALVDERVVVIVAPPLDLIGPFGIRVFA